MWQVTCSPMNYIEGTRGQFMKFIPSPKRDMALMYTYIERKLKTDHSKAYKELRKMFTRVYSTYFSRR